jgi:hypothetical protein
MKLNRTELQMVLGNAQPSVVAPSPEAPLMTLKMWVMVVTTGQGAGITSAMLGADMAAAYNVPLGDALFAVEVLLGWLRQRQRTAMPL